jgi:acetyltransferase-like isoleucine patch superfamily enzyme
LFGVRIGSLYEVHIGQDAVVEDAAIADTDFHSVHPSRGAPELESLARCRIVIGDRALVGARSIVTKGVEIGTAGVVLPGSVVVRRVPAGAVVQGNPAHVLGAAESAALSPRGSHAATVAVPE